MKAIHCREWGTPDDLQEFTTSTCTVLGITSARCRDLAIGSPLVLNRTASPAGQERRPAFLLVGQIDPAQPAAQPQITFQTLPDSAVKMLKYVLSDRDYRWETFTVDATAFPATSFRQGSPLQLHPRGDRRTSIPTSRRKGDLGRLVLDL